MAQCTACSRPAPDATICPNCTGVVESLLRAVPDLVDELTITLTRQARMVGRGATRSTETLLVYEHRASVDLEDMRTELGRWADVVAAHRGVIVDAGHDDSKDLSRWLLRWVGAAAQHPDARDLLDEVRGMVRAAERTIDRAPDRRFVGPCDQCGEDLYVGLFGSTVTCRTEDCEATYPINERRAWLREQAEDQLRTAAEIAREMPWLAGIDTTSEKLRKKINDWARRDRITRYLPHPHDPRESPRFRVGEVMALLRVDADAASDEATGAA